MVTNVDRLCALQQLFRGAKKYLSISLCWSEYENTGAREPKPQ